MLLNKQNLCLDKGYDYPEIERESIYQKKIRATYSSKRCGEKELIKAEYVTKRWVVIEKNKFLVAQQIQKVISKYKRNQKTILH